MYYLIAEEDAFGVLDWKTMEKCQEYVSKARAFNTVSEAVNYVDRELDYMYKIKFHIEAGVCSSYNDKWLGTYEINKIKKINF